MIYIFYLYVKGSSDKLSMVVAISTLPMSSGESIDDFTVGVGYIGDRTNDFFGIIIDDGNEFLFDTVEAYVV